ncbi:MAG: lipoate--protein ligase family protein [Cyanobacteria bacterium J06629_19]
MPKKWRLIPHMEAAGTQQMAIDSWLLNQHMQGLQPPSLRFYTWAKPTISLGYHQRQFPAHWNHLIYKGEPVELVRRPTGGRAVLHQGDLTYALVTSGVNGSRREVYEQLCQFLIEGWKTLGVELSFGVAGRGYVKNPNCFGTATAADLVMADGCKLIGSAQVYKEDCVLQHGSIRLNPDNDLFEAVFGERITQPKILSDLSSIKGISQIEDFLTIAAESRFNAELSVKSMTAVEVENAMRSQPIRLAQPST